MIHARRPALVALAACLAATLVVAAVQTTGCGGGDCRDAVPEGSYSQSCSECRMDGSELHCKCGNGHGAMLDTKLDTCDCPIGTEIGNCFGTLTCGNCDCLSNGIACGPSGAAVSACCSGYCGSNGTCE